MSTAVTEAQRQLDAAVAVEGMRRRETAKQEIKRLRHEGAALLKRFRPLAAQVKQAQADRLRLHYELVKARNNIAAYRTPLDPSTFPSDEDVAKQARALVGWQAQNSRNCWRSTRTPAAASRCACTRWRYRTASYTCNLKFKI